ncbi:hypothetical protein V8J88_19970 [Massilia sp. W12]|uniref:hypothetical protein n=1 Tax=Massilia sp. W12 TaxID=3126507 RepID=UPI0030CE2D25
MASTEQQPERQENAASDSAAQAVPVEPKPVEKQAILDLLVKEKSRNSPIRFACINLYPADVALADEPQLEEVAGDAYSNTWTPKKPLRSALTKENGTLQFRSLKPGKYYAEYAHLPKLPPFALELKAGRNYAEICIDYDVQMHFQSYDKAGRPKQGLPAVGERLEVALEHDYDRHVRARPVNTDLQAVSGKSGVFATRLQQEGRLQLAFEFSIPALQNTWLTSSTGNLMGPTEAASLGEKVRPVAQFVVTTEIEIMTNAMDTMRGGTGCDSVNVTIGRTDSPADEDVSLWNSIRESTEALSFDNYSNFIGLVIDGQRATDKSALMQEFQRMKQTRSISFMNGEAYRLLRAATEAFVMVNAGVDPAKLEPTRSRLPGDDVSTKPLEYMDSRDINARGMTRDTYDNEYLQRDPSGSENRLLPYLALIRRKLPELEIANLNTMETQLGYSMVQERLRYPLMLELIWSYWQEEGMLVQTTNAITRRFQNVRAPQGNDPLANLETDPLRPLNNLLWGYLQDEQNRLTVVRRNYEYDHHYGLRLEGKAVRDFRPADTRSKFLEAFHHLLRMCSQFFRQDDDTTVKADAFPVLNALKEVHLVLSQGAHNQYGDLPSVARVEMLMQQWLLARPEFREFLPTRIMVAYPEPWMDRVDSMKKLQGWGDTSVLHFRSLAMFGEQILLSVRFGAWSDVFEPSQAFNWARFWRPQIQGYIHAYRAATGVDLTGTATDTVVDATMPSVLLQRRLDQQHRAA